MTVNGQLKTRCRRRIPLTVVAIIVALITWRHALWIAPDTTESPKIVAHENTRLNTREPLSERTFATLWREEATQCVPPEWPAHKLHPHIFIVGFGKTGSTYMHRVLVQHPHIAQARTKELNYIPRFGRPLQPLEKYASNFPNVSSSNKNAVSIDASVIYVRLPTSRDILRQTFTCARIIFLMRDPTTRWWSNYNHEKRLFEADAIKYNRTERSYATFEQLYDRDLNSSLSTFERLGFTREVQQAGVSVFSLRRQHTPLHSIPEDLPLIAGLYYSRVVEWLDVWPRSQVLLVNTEECFDPATLNDKMRVITDFVGLPPHTFTRVKPKLPVAYDSHKAPGDYGPLPEPYVSAIRAFYEPDLKLLKEHFGISFASSTP